MIMCISQCFPNPCHLPRPSLSRKPPLFHTVFLFILSHSPGSGSPFLKSAASRGVNHSPSALSPSACWSPLHTPQPTSDSPSTSTCCSGHLQLRILLICLQVPAASCVHVLFPRKGLPTARCSYLGNLPCTRLSPPSQSLPTYHLSIRQSVPKTF